MFSAIDRCFGVTQISQEKANSRPFGLAPPSEWYITSAKRSGSNVFYIGYKN